MSMADAPAPARRVLFAVKPSSIEVPLNDIEVNVDIRQVVNNYFDSLFDMMDRARVEDQSTEDRLDEINSSSEAYNIVLRDRTVRQYDNRVDTRPRKPGFQNNEELFRFVLITRLTDVQEWSVVAPILTVYCKCFDVISGRIDLDRNPLELDDQLKDNVEVIQTAVQVSPIEYSMKKMFLREHMAKFIEIQTKARVEGLGGHHA